jgi:4-hydroxy-4-methyl-2-oxoglutarate aldolase
MNKTISQIIQYINNNRISSTQTADALGKKGVIDHDFIPMNPTLFVSGQIEYIYASNKSNWTIHQGAESLSKDKIIYVDNIDCGDLALFGELVAKYIILYKSCKGIIVNGRLRDISEIKKYNFPVWYKGNNPLGCFNSDIELTDDQYNIVKNRKEYFEKCIVVADQTGVTFIEDTSDLEDLYTRLENIENLEDLWSYCINVLKWSTYETICKKRYLKDRAQIPDVLLKHIK